MKKGRLTQTRSKPGGDQFLLDIRYQQHNSWQGTVQRLDTGETVGFRSVLELLGLIEAVVGKKGEAPEDGQRLRGWKKERKVEIRKSTGE